MQVPIETSLPPDANWTAGLAAFKAGNYAEAARRFEAVADAAPDQASSWTLSAGSFWAGRANLLAGNPQKFAPYLKRAALHGRTFHGLIAQKALGMRIEPDWNVPALDRRRADVLKNDRAGTFQSGSILMPSAFWAIRPWKVRPCSAARLRYGANFCGLPARRLARPAQNEPAERVHDEA